MIRNPIVYRTAVLAAILLLAGACSRGPAPSGPNGMTEKQVQALIAQRTAQDPFLRSQTEIGLEVRMDTAGVLIVTLTNKTERALRIGPENFGIIVTGTRRVSSALGTSHAKFPVVDVKPGDHLSGELLFPATLTVAGNRLVFLHPQLPDRPAMALIH
jgi:hypothetical protein